MKEIDKNEYVERYSERLEEFGHSPETLGWGSHKKKHIIRYKILSELARRHPESSVLDVGCGFADMYEFMLAAGWKGRYTGIDIVPGLLDVARNRHPNLDVREMDISEEHAVLDEYDFVLATGIFGAALSSGQNEAHVERTLKIMFHHAKRAVCVDFQSSYVDFQKEGAWHADPAWLLPVARAITKRVDLRMDYMPYEFMLTLYQEDEISSENYFAAME
jgi:SAM-dependent methyltransferase